MKYDYDAANANSNITDAKSSNFCRPQQHQWSWERPPLTPPQNSLFLRKLFPDIFKACVLKYLHYIPKCSRSWLLKLNNIMITAQIGPPPSTFSHQASPGTDTMSECWGATCCVCVFVGVGNEINGQRFNFNYTRRILLPKTVSWLVASIYSSEPSHAFSSSSPRSKIIITKYMIHPSHMVHTESYSWTGFGWTGYSSCARVNYGGISSVQSSVTFRSRNDFILCGWGSGRENLIWPPECNLIYWATVHKYSIKAHKGTLWR